MMWLVHSFSLGVWKEIQVSSLCHVRKVTGICTIHPQPHLPPQFIISFIINFMIDQFNNNRYAEILLICIKDLISKTRSILSWSAL